MPNYNESTVTGSRWTRCHGGSFSNNYNSTPNIVFNEEEIVLLDGGETIKKAPTGTGMAAALWTDMSNPQKEFNLLNPYDGTVIGTMKYQDIFVALHSLYMALAKERDSAVNTQQPATVTPQPTIVDPTPTPATPPVQPTTPPVQPTTPPVV